jgi:hypothetical protein
MSNRGERWVTWLVAGLIVLVVTFVGPFTELVFGVRIPRWLVLLVAVASVGVGVGSAVLAFQAVRFALRGQLTRRLRLELFETDYGRTAGWYVERAGQPVAVLLDPRFEDMFWDSYQVEPLVDDPNERSRIQCDQRWWHQRGLVFRNRYFGAAADTAFAAGDVFTEDGRVIVRGLYFRGADPDSWERIVMWARRRLGRARVEPGAPAVRRPTRVILL